MTESAPPPSPLPMPSRREFFVGMTLLIVVGGYVTTRGGRSARLMPMDTQSITAGVLTTPDEFTESDTPIANILPTVNSEGETLQTMAHDDETPIGQ